MGMAQGSPCRVPWPLPAPVPSLPLILTLRLESPTCSFLLSWWRWQEDMLHVCGSRYQ